MEEVCRAILKFVTRLQILLVFKQKIYCSFLQMEGVGGHTILIIFCGRHERITPKWFKITTNSVTRGSSFFFNIKPDTF